MTEESKREETYRRSAEQAAKEVASWPAWKRNPPYVYRCDAPNCPFHHHTPDERCRQ